MQGGFFFLYIDSAVAGRKLSGRIARPTCSYARGIICTSIVMEVCLG